jgi:hypothetical protein
MAANPIWRQIQDGVLGILYTLLQYGYQMRGLVLTLHNLKKKGTLP